MQSQQTRPQVAAPTPATRSGPVPLDPKDLQHVAGGLPRGGWSTDTSTTTSLPRGGW